MIVHEKSLDEMRANSGIGRPPDLAEAGEKEHFPRGNFGIRELFHEPVLLYRFFSHPHEEKSTVLPENNKKES